MNEAEMKQLEVACEKPSALIRRAIAMGMSFRRCSFDQCALGVARYLKTGEHVGPVRSYMSCGELYSIFGLPKLHIYRVVTRFDDGHWTAEQCAAYLESEGF